MNVDNENDLVKKESLAEMLNDSSIDRVMAIDLNWNIIAWNKTSESISGISKDKILGKNFLDAFPQITKDEEMLQAITAAFEGKKTFLPSNHSSFNRHFYENHFIPLKDHTEQVVGVMNIMHDVAHRIKVEKQLQRLNTALEKKYQQLEKANGELATFTYITSRDIKEPLRHVYTSLELLAKKDGEALSNVSRGNLRRMQGSLNRMNLLLDDILAVSSIGNQNTLSATVNLDEVLKEAMANLHRKIQEKNAIIEASPLPSIPGYREMLVYLFQNLIDNALKFQPDYSTPAIQVSCEAPVAGPLLKKDLSPEKDYIRISFTDNGIGFDQEDSKRIFNMFERLHDKKFHGSGIGLTICKKIVETHDGIIEAESEINKGSTFLCYLPVMIDANDE